MDDRWIRDGVAEVRRLLDAGEYRAAGEAQRYLVEKTVAFCRATGCRLPAEGVAPWCDEHRPAVLLSLGASPPKPRRGPRPRSDTKTARLFALLTREPDIDTRDACERIGIERASFYVLRSRFKRERRAREAA